MLGGGRGDMGRVGWDVRIRIPFRYVMDCCHVRVCDGNGKIVRTVFGGRTRDVYIIRRIVLVALGV